MNNLKIAFFVEGQTELIFVHKFLMEYFTGGVYIKNAKKLGTKVISIDIIDSKEKNFYIRITNTGGGNRKSPLSFLKNKISKLVEEEFKFFITLSDLYYNGTETENLKEAVGDIKWYINEKLSKYSGMIKPIIAVMETEAWFLADYNFPAKKDSKLTPEYINQEINIDLVNADIEKIYCPTDIIKKIYALVNDEYKKKHGQTCKITESYVDYTFLYSDEVRNRVKSWNYFCNCVEEIFSN